MSGRSSAIEPAPEARADHLLHRFTEEEPRLAAATQSEHLSIGRCVAVGEVGEFVRLEVGECNREVPLDGHALCFVQIAADAFETAPSEAGMTDLVGVDAGE